ncbi:major facilitator superfamily transporter [Ophiostoma piceae UAMH 11346]|uniref:Major facilitator superfamily transporter n=1 Tax=Ophiostoma piceae (strain UAMH 11346) TaxID=1262450 RepID=S3BZI7_OPHP1|nr:major facilitator superfamily transporter [Ophiostoma piceae UAMH 11346]
MSTKSENVEVAPATSENDATSLSARQAADPALPAVLAGTGADATTAAVATAAVSQEKRGWFHWHEPGTSKEEKFLIFKLDWFILSYSCLCFFIKQLDGNNVSNAYVSGMSEDLGFGKGNELSWMNTYFNCGVLIGGPIANLIITVVRPRYWLPFCLSVWSIFVLGMYKCTTAHQYYALRFCCGLFESAAWPGITYTLGCWYRKSELARRSSLFVISGVLGQMFSGYLQSALYSGMDGRGGLRAWRWLFIFDFILAIPVVIYGLIFFPDTPEQTKAFYLNDWERKRVVERIREEGRAPVGKMDLSVIKRIFGSWQVYGFTLGYALWSLTAGSYIMQYFALYLKSTKKFSVVQINNIPTAIGAVNFFVMISTGFIADKIGRRGPVCLGVGSVLIFCYIILTIWSVPHGLRMVAYILVGFYGCFTPLLAGWVNESCGGDQQKRGFILGFMVSVGGAVIIPFQQYQFPSSQAPKYSKTHGWGSALAMVIALTLWMSFGLPAFQKWAQKREQTIKADEEHTKA